MPGMTNFGQRLSRLTPVSLSVSAVTTLTTLDSHVFHVTRATDNILSSVKLKYVMRNSLFEMDRDRTVKM